MKRGGGGGIWVGSEKKGIFLFPDLLGKGYIFKALGQAWLTISCWKWTHWGADRPATFVQI